LPAEAAVDAFLSSLRSSARITKVAVARKELAGVGLCVRHACYLTGEEEEREEGSEL